MYNNALWVTTHSGKMENIWSISTNNLINPLCMARKSCAESVCSKCYADTLLQMRKSLDEHTTENYELLTTRILEYDELPLITDDIFRIESFGDVANVTHAINYLNMIKKNTSTFFGWWTKNITIVDEAIAKVGKPENMNLLQSSMYMNKPAEYRSPNADASFTVYDKKYIAENGVDVNCGGKKCRDCMACYRKGLTDRNEQLK